MRDVLPNYIHLNNSILKEPVHFVELVVDLDIGRDPDFSISSVFLCSDHLTTQVLNVM